MSIGENERATQDRVVDFFKNTLAYTYLGNLKDSANKNIREDILRQYLKDCGYSEKLISSIISDDNMIQEFNHLNSIERHQIIREIKNIDTSKKVETLSFEWNLRIVEIHIISGKHNIDPAVVLLTGIFKNVERIVLS